MGLKDTKVVVALGGNALQESGSPATAEAQLEVVRKTCEFLADINLKGYEMAIVHGNGPQVGRIALGQELAAKHDPKLPAMPFDVCGAMSQGYIGYQIQQCLRDALRNRNRNVPVVTLVSQVVVDEDDSAFKNPTKPIGPFYSEEEAKQIAEEKGYTMKEDAGRGWRRVVASPKPKRIAEIDSVKRLWDSTIVITAGGGGIPVIENMDGSLEGVPAVIDKDFTSEKLAELVDADVFIILTAVEKVAIKFGQPDEQWLDTMTVEECEKYIADEEFAAGSMLPKVEAALKFAKSKPGRKTLITSLEKAAEALDGKTGTWISSK